MYLSQWMVLHSGHVGRLPGLDKWIAKCEYISKLLLVLLGFYSMFYIGVILYIQIKVARQETG